MRLRRAAPTAPILPLPMSVHSPRILPATVFADDGRLVARGRVMHSSTVTGVLAELLAVAAIVAALRDEADGTLLLVWIGYMALAAFLRLAVSLRPRVSPGLPRQLVNMERRLTWLWAAAGVGWGIAAAAVIPLETQVREVLVLLVICAMVVLALEVLHASRAIALAYALPATLLPALGLAATGDPLRAAIAALLMVFLALVLLGVIRRSRAFDLDLAERDRNERLVDELGQAERSLREAVAEERAVFEAALAGLAIVRDGRFVRCNRAAERIFGYRRGSMNGLSTRVLYPDEAEWHGATEAVEAELEAGAGFHGEREFMRRDGEVVGCRCHAQWIDAEDPARGAIWVFEDLTDERRVAAAIRAGEERVAQAAAATRAANTRLVDAISCVPDAFALFDRHDRLVLCNEVFLRAYPGSPPLEAVFGKTYEDLVIDGIHAGEAVPAEYRKDLPRWVERVMARHRNPGGGDLVYQDGDGAWWQVRERQTSEGGTVVLKSDISELKRAEERVRHLANHDPLTGLPNRRLLDDRIGQALGMAQRSGQHVGVMLIDLDRFKVINDTQGHEAGDRVLQEVSRRLRTTVRQVDTVARQGGDEFVVILPELRRANDAERVAGKILQQLDRPVMIDGVAVNVGASIGVSVYPGDGAEPEVLLKAADAAMYRAKRAGRSRLEVVARVPQQFELELP